MKIITIKPEKAQEESLSPLQIKTALKKYSFQMKRTRRIESSSSTFVRRAQKERVLSVEEKKRLINNYTTDSAERKVPGDGAQSQMIERKQRQ